MDNPFSVFYTETVEIVHIEEKGVYAKTYTETPLKSVTADIQPYSGNLAEEEYGLKIECQLRMYCDKCAEVTEGNHVRYSGKLYRIIYAPKWKLGAEALLKEVEEYVSD